MARRLVPASLHRHQEDVLEEPSDLTEIGEWIEFSAAGTSILSQRDTWVGRCVRCSGSDASVHQTEVGALRIGRDRTRRRRAVIPARAG